VSLYAADRVADRRVSLRSQLYGMQLPGDMTDAIRSSKARDTQWAAIQLKNEMRHDLQQQRRPSARSRLAGYMDAARHPIAARQQLQLRSQERQFRAQWEGSSGERKVS
jgi:hypothetical protein